MKLTDDKRAELVEWTKICGGYRMPDMVVELLESEQAAWQEVDRLREENERLKSQLDDAVSMLLHAKELYGLEMWGETLRYEEVKLEQAIQRIKGEGTE